MWEDRSSVKVGWATRGLELCQNSLAVCHIDELGDRSIVFTAVVVVVILLGQETGRCGLAGG